MRSRKDFCGPMCAGWSGPARGAEAGGTAAASRGALRAPVRPTARRSHGHLDAHGEGREVLRAEAGVELADGGDSEAFAEDLDGSQGRTGLLRGREVAKAYDRGVGRNPDAARQQLGYCCLAPIHRGRRNRPWDGGAHADAPLFLCHLLEFSDVPFNLDVAELNDRWADPDMIDSWSQMVIKHTWLRRYPLRTA